MKICCKCKQTKDIVEFNKNTTKKDGRQNTCKICDKQYRQENIEQRKQYNQKNAEKIAEQHKQYYKKNFEKILKYSKQYQRERKKSDLLFKFKYNVRTLVRRSFKRNKTKNFKKQTKTETLLGCTIPELRDHLAKQFQPGMTFENHGEWHVDHRIPLASAKTQEQIEKLCHYTNLQPLWALDNLRKQDKY